MTFFWIYLFKEYLQSSGQPLSFSISNRFIVTLHILFWFPFTLLLEKHYVCRNNQDFNGMSFILEFEYMISKCVNSVCQWIGIELSQTLKSIALLLCWLGSSQNIFKLQIWKTWKRVFMLITCLCWIKR